MSEAFIARSYANMNALSEAYPHGTPCIVLRAMRDVENGINAGIKDRPKPEGGDK